MEGELAHMVPALPQSVLVT